MARIRSLKPETAQDRKLAGVSPIARLMFLYGITIADDDGLFRAEDSHLKAQLFPYDDDFSPEVLRRLSGELVESGLWVEHRTRDGCRVIEIVNWSKHQQIKNRSKPFLANELASPSGKSPETLPRPSGDPPESLRQPSGEAPEALRTSSAPEPRVLSPESRVLSVPNGTADEITPAVVLREAHVPEAKIGDGIRWWRAMAERFAVDEIALVVRAEGQRPNRHDGWNPAAVWNVHNDDCWERFKLAIQRERKHRPAGVALKAAMRELAS